MKKLLAIALCVLFKNTDGIRDDFINLGGVLAK